MKILITGGAGFLGFHLAKWLSEGENNLVLADNFSRGKKDIDLLRVLSEHPNVQLRAVDFTKPEEVNSLGEGYDRVYHFAAVNGTKNFYEMPHRVLRTNILSAVYILDWFSETQSKKSKIFFASSSETYAGTAMMLPQFPIPTPEHVPLCVEDVNNPRRSYGGSKIAGELLFLNYAKAHNIRVSITRYHNVYGPRMGYEHVIPEFYKRIWRKENPFPIFGGTETRAFCYVDDMVIASQKVMESERTDGEIVNIGNDQEEITIRELADLMFQVTGFESRYDIKPAPEGSVRRRCPDLTKLRSLTGYEPTVSLKEGLEKTWAWYQEDLQQKTS